MKNKSILALGASLLAASLVQQSHAQIVMSAGTYTQNFNTLATNGTTNPWVDNSTLAGWYASRALPVDSNSVAVYIASPGSSTTGALYSFGSTGSNDRALGAIESNGTGALAYGLRLMNDTASAQTDIKVSVTGEQWRNGGNTTAQKILFSYQVGTSLTNSDAAGLLAWSALTSLDFTGPIATASAAATDGNASTNRTVFNNVTLLGVTVPPGQELFLRWYDANDSGNDHGLGIDDVSVSFTATNAVDTAPSIIFQPQNQTNVQGSTATFSVTAGGTSPLSYQWYSTGSSFNNSAATNAIISIPFVSLTSDTGYFVVVSNALGTATSAVATLTVTLPPPPVVTNIAYLHTLLDTTNYAPQDTTNLYSVEGVVTTHTNITTPGNISFFVQDSTGGIVVFESGTSTCPAAGDWVRVVGSLANFNGELEFALNISNANHSITVLSNSVPLPTPVPFDFATQTNVPYMESFVEGRRVIVSNAFLQNAGSANGFQAGSNVNLTNVDGKILVFRVDARVIELIGQPIPEVATLIGVMGQFDQNAPLTNAYQLFVTRLADVIPTVPQVPLKITKTSTNTTVSWSAVPAGFSLETTPSLSPTNWQPAVGTVVVTNSQNVITITPTTNGFFRAVGQRPLF